MLQVKTLQCNRDDLKTMKTECEDANRSVMLLFDSTHTLMVKVRPHFYGLHSTHISLHES